METAPEHNFFMILRDVSARLGLKTQSLKAKRKEKIKRVKYNWQQLEGNLELQELYTVESHNTFQLLGREEGQQLTRGSN
ncbi:unnamed protein product [Merluccius merluccius]